MISKMFMNGLHLAPFSKRDVTSVTGYAIFLLFFWRGGKRAARSNPTKGILPSKQTAMTKAALPVLILILILLDRSTVWGNYNNFFFNNRRPESSPIINDDDPYKVLGVKRTASDEEVQKAYRKRAKETHRKRLL